MDDTAGPVRAGAKRGPAAGRGGEVPGERRRRLGLVSVLAAAVLLGTAGTIATLGPDDLRPATVAAWRTTVGGAGLAVLAVSARRRAPAPGRTGAVAPLPWRWVGLGAVGLLVNQFAFFEAVERAGVATGTLVTVAAVPAAAGMIDRLDRRPPGLRWLVGVATAVAGVALLTGVGGGADPVGVVVAAAAGAAAALWGRCAQQVMRERPPVEALALIVGGAAAVVAPLALARAGEALASPGAAATVVLLGLVTTTAAFRLWGAGLAVLPLAVVGAATLLEPVVATALAVVLVGEPAGVGTVAGAALVVVGVGVSTARQ